MARREHQQKTADVRALFMAWDPIGVADEPDAWDEYDCMIGPALSRLRRGADVAALREWIAHERDDHFELPADELADAALAVLTGQVGQSGDGGLVAAGGVGSVVVVLVEPCCQGGSSFGL